MAAPTIDRPGTRAQVRFVRMSASKARVVLKLIRGKGVAEAAEILQFTERLAADPIAKCLRSAVANAEHNEDLQADDLFISTCYADEGPTLKRFRPRARGRAGRIHKQTCHITIEVARYTDDELDEARKRDELKSEGRQRRSASSAGGDRARRVAKSRAAESADTESEETDEVAEDQVETVEEATEVTETEVAEDTADAAEDTAETTEADETDTDETDAEAEASDTDATDEAADDDTDADAGEKS